MKNEDIHVGLEDKEVRDFLGREYQVAHMQGMGNAEYVRRQIEKLEQTLEMIKRRDVLIAIMKDRGWNSWDISDTILYNPETYFSFIGTEEEYRRIKEEK